MMNLLDENLSDSMEMYLVTIANLRKGDAPVPLSQLAGSLEVTSVSVNEMCRKLEDYGRKTGKSHPQASPSVGGVFS
jgi:biotin operon repressor